MTIFRTHLAYDDKLRMMINHHRGTGQYVPVAAYGQLFGLMASRQVSADSINPNMSVSTYVASLELVGYRFACKMDFEAGEDRIELIPSRDPLPTSWALMAARVTAAFGSERSDEVLAYLHRREEALRNRDIIAAMASLIELETPPTDGTAFVRERVPDATVAAIEGMAELFINRLNEIGADRAARAHVEGAAS